MTAYITLDRVEVSDAHEDGAFGGDGEWRLDAWVNGTRKTFRDGSVDDGDNLNLGTNRTWDPLAVNPGDPITFAGQAWEEDPWPNPDDRLGSASETGSFQGDYNDFPVPGGDYTMYFDINFV